MARAAVWDVHEESLTKTVPRVTTEGMKILMVPWPVESRFTPPAYQPEPHPSKELRPVAEATELMGRMSVDRGGDYVLSSPDPLQHSKRKGGSGEYSTFLCLFEISVVQSDWLIWQFFPPVLSLIPRHHPVRISLPVQWTGKPHAILKAIHTGVGFGSGTETNLYWASLTQTTYLYSSHLYRPP